MPGSTMPNCSGGVSNCCMLPWFISSLGYIYSGRCGKKKQRVEKDSSTTTHFLKSPNVKSNTVYVFILGRIAFFLHNELSKVRFGISFSSRGRILIRISLLLLLLFFKILKNACPRFLIGRLTFLIGHVFTIDIHALF